MDFFTIPTLYATYNLIFKRYEKKFFLAGAILVMSAAAVVGYKVYNQSQMSAFMKANIEALTQSEGTAKCEVSLACDMLNPAYNKVSCTGFRECHRYPAERYVECDGIITRCNG